MADHGRQNSQIRAKGVGKNAVRHDLDGTPGLSEGSSLQQGDVQELERGQSVVQDTQQRQTIAAKPVQRAPGVQAEGPMAVPDATQFAIEKLGGGDLTTAGQGRIEQKADFSNWLPLLRRLSVSPTSSGILQRAFLKRMTQELQRPMGTNAALIRQRDFDDRLEQLNGAR